MLKKQKRFLCNKAMYDVLVGILCRELMWILCFYLRSFALFVLFLEFCAAQARMLLESWIWTLEQWQHLQQRELNDELISALIVYLEQKRWDADFASAFNISQLQVELRDF